MKFKHMISGKTVFISGIAAVIMMTAFFACGGKLKARGEELSIESEMPEDTGSIEDPSSVIFVNGGSTDSESGISLDFSYGFKNTAKSGRMIPFNAGITNNSDEDIIGKLIIEVPGSIETGSGDFDNAVISYSFNVSIEAGGSYEVRDTISISEGDSDIRLKLCDEEGNSLASLETGISIAESTGPHMLIGILSDTPERLEFIRDINITNTPLITSTMELDPADLPGSASGYEQLDMLLVTGFDIGRLSREAIEAIEQWVDAGGVLLIGTGDCTEAAEKLGEHIEELELDLQGKREVNMGLKYSDTDPDDAVVELDICSVFASGGIQVMQSDDIAMLTTVQQNNGLIGIAAYDLCDIDSFCSEEAEYASDLIRYMFGTSRLTRLINSDEDSEGTYMAADALVGMADPDRLPEAAGYIIAAIAYLFAVGFIYTYLKSKGLSLFYHAFLPAAAFMAGIFIWLLSSSLRISGISLDYAVIRELNEGTNTDTGFMKMSSPSLREFHLTAPLGYTIHPIVHGADQSYMNSMDGEAFAGSSAAMINIENAEDRTLISVAGLRPFDGVLAEYSCILDEGTTGNVETQLQYFDGSLTGSISNGTGFRLDDAAVLMYGKIIKVGTIDPGETVILDGLKAVDSPISGGEASAAYIVGLQDADRQEEYVRALRRSRLLGYYMDKYLCGYYSGARFVAFTDDYDLMGDVGSVEHVKSQGCMLVAGRTEADFTRGNDIWLSCFTNEPSVVSGDYDPATNTTIGSCILEYSIGTDIEDVESIRINGISEMFETDGLKAFDGTVSIYNYQTGSYDIINSGNAAVNGPDVWKYLSPGNAITVRYSAGDQNGGARMYLPVPEASGLMRQRYD